MRHRTAGTAPRCRRPKRGRPRSGGFFAEIVQRVGGHDGYGAPNSPFRIAALKRLMRLAGMPHRWRDAQAAGRPGCDHTPSDRPGSPLGAAARVAGASLVGGDPISPALAAGTPWVRAMAGSGSACRVSLSASPQRDEIIA